MTNLNATLLALSHPVRRGVLARLQHGEVAVNELASSLRVSGPALTRHLHVLERAGLITRSTADDDRRGIEIAVTDDGRAALLAAIESHLRLVAALFSDRLTATDQAALSWVLSKLLVRATPEFDASREE